MRIRHLSAGRIRSLQSGLTRIELMFLLILLVVLGLAAYVPISAYLAQHGVARAVQCGHTLDTLLSQYATDNNGVYPVGEGTPDAGKSEGVARDLLENNYTPDASIFSVGSTPRYRGTATDFSDLGAASMSWDFTAGANATTGITTAAPESLPVVFTTGQTITYPKPGGSSHVPLSGAGPFASQGMVVSYKDNTARFIKATPSGSGFTCTGFFPANFSDSSTYTQIKP